MAGRVRSGKAWMATAVPTKGQTGRFAADRCLDFIAECGDQENEIIIKSDQEPAIEKVMGDIVKNRDEGKTLVEVAPVQGSKSNGEIEKGHSGHRGPGPSA